MPKINFHVILKFIGILLCMESIFMLVPFVVALIYGEGDAPAFIKSSAASAVAIFQTISCNRRWYIILHF